MQWQNRVAVDFFEPGGEPSLPRDIVARQSWLIPHCALHHAIVRDAS